MCRAVVIVVMNFWEGLDWIYLAQDTDTFCAVVYMAVSVWG